MSTRLFSRVRVSRGIAEIVHIGFLLLHKEHLLRGDSHTDAGLDPFCKMCLLSS